MGRCASAATLPPAKQDIELPIPLADALSVRQNGQWMSRAMQPADLGLIPRALPACTPLRRWQVVAEDPQKIMEPLQPTGLALRGQRLVIHWNDGRTLEYAPAELRAACPCAGCVGAHGEQPQPSSPDAEIRITQMQPVGNYAYRIEFSDGHATGIFPLELLRRLGTENKQ